MQKLCLICRLPYGAQRDDSQYCSGRCRISASRKRRADALNAALGEIQHGLVKARRVLGGEGEDLD